jgi:hypothetical protein
VQSLHLSFLAREEARELIEHPTPEFALGYEPGVVDRILDLTHGQPYLVQAIGSEIVNRINSQNRKTATQADLDAAIERVLELSEAYLKTTGEIVRRRNRRCCARWRWTKRQPGRRRNGRPHCRG